MHVWSMQLYEWNILEFLRESIKDCFRIVGTAIEDCINPTVWPTAEQNRNKYLVD